ncbi:MAG: hypothetical protein AUG75_02690 [Cyanobacteria bacterium 13_1_20CM_4_61_6]|nr:MAG: hypothetical protein AUG75_02690 [Cyanobacteria bacterium 13_1_20CM_4_61_6]
MLGRGPEGPLFHACAHACAIQLDDATVEERDDVTVEERDDVTVEERDDVTVEERDDVTVEERRFSAALGAPSTWALAPGVALTNGMRGNSRRRFAE